MLAHAHHQPTKNASQARFLAVLQPATPGGRDSRGTKHKSLAIFHILDKERQGRVAAEQQAAVLGTKLEGANERTGKAEAAKVEAAKNTISNLTGKLEAMQTQIERQAWELDVARQGAAKAGRDAAELRGSGKPAAKAPKAPSKE